MKRSRCLGEGEKGRRSRRRRRRRSRGGGGVKKAENLIK